MRVSPRSLLCVTVCLLAVVDRCEIANAELKPTTFTYKSVGELEIKADVYRPDGDAMRPVVAWYHGGALMMGSRTGVPKQLIELSEKHGFVLVSFDYRLLPEAKLPDVIEDLKDGLNWIRSDGPELFQADPEKMVVAGASAGGYLSIMSGISITPPPTAIVSYWGFGDVDKEWTTTPNEAFRKMGLISKEDAWATIGDEVVTSTDKQSSPDRWKLFIYLKQNGLWAKVASGFDPETEADKLAAYSPIRHLTEDYPPILMLHGTADADVPYEKSVEMAAELKRLGTTYELITVENGRHSLWGGDPEKIQQAFDRSMEYIREHLTAE